MNKRFPLYVTFAVFSLFACKKAEVKTYSVPKEVSSRPMMPPAMGGNDMMNSSIPVSAETSQDLKWAVPSGWTEQAPSSMRVASFMAKGDHGHDTDISVVSLGGMAGGLLANVNRWREQIGLSPINEEQLQKDLTHLTSAAGPVSVVDLISTEKLIHGEHHKRIMAAILEAGEKTWFFKMTGEKNSIEQQKPAFRQFLQSLQKK